LKVKGNIVGSKKVLSSANIVAKEGIFVGEQVQVVGIPAVKVKSVQACASGEIEAGFF
jgi:hypothetical protein